MGSRTTRDGTPIRPDPDFALARCAVSVAEPESEAGEDAHCLTQEEEGEGDPATHGSPASASQHVDE
jgi:hypothetical protein